MGRIYAIGGHEDERMFRYIVEKSGKSEPHFLFVATASGDRPDYYAQMSLLMSKLGCKNRPFYLIRRGYTENELDEIFSWADIVYLCGGDTYKMIKLFRENGIDRRLKAIFDDDSAILCGASAGGICWFQKGFSDSSRSPIVGKHGWVDGIGIFPDLVFCPHYNSRAEAFEDAVRNEKLEGFGLDNDTAYVYDDGREYFLSLDGNRRIAVYRQTDDGFSVTTPKALVLTEYYPD